MIVPPDPSRPIIKDDGTMQDAFRLYTFLTALLDPFVGTGSPEGVVVAEQKQLYMDDAGGAGSVLYIKRDSDVGGDRSQGWILV